MDDFTLDDLERRVAERANADRRRVLHRASCSIAASRNAPRSSARRRSKLALAAVGESRERLIAETADLLYHLLVVLKARGIKLSEVESVLGDRAQRRPDCRKRPRARRLSPARMS